MTARMAELVNNNLQRAIILFTSMISIIIIGTDGHYLRKTNETMSEMKYSLSDDNRNESIGLPPFDISLMACENETFCENPPFYPEDYIKSIVKTLSPELTSIIDQNGPPPPERRKRGPPDADPEIVDGLCESEERYIVPRSGQSEAGEWFYVVNVPGRLQWVHHHGCRHSGETDCTNIFLPLGYEGKCKEKRIARRFTGISWSGDPEPIFFMIPVACCCHIKDAYFEKRYGFSSSD